MNKSVFFRLTPLIVFLILAFIFMRGLFLEPQVIPSVKINKRSPAFQLKNLYSNVMIDQSVFTGDWTILNVWASWCDACAIEHALLLKLSQKGYKIIGLNYKDDNISAKSWLSNYGNPYQLVLIDNTGKVSIDFGVYGSPETFLIDKEGIIRLRHVGVLDDKTWQQSFLPLMNKKFI